MGRSPEPAARRARAEEPARSPAALAAELARTRRALRREEALGRIRDQIIGLGRLEEVPGKLEETWVGELRGLGIPIHRISLQFPAAREGYFSSYRDAFLRQQQRESGCLADYPWVGEVWQSGQPAVVGEERLRQAPMPPEVQSLVEVPLPDGGSLGVNSLSPGAFGEEEVQLLKQVAGLLDLGLERLRALETLRRAEEAQRIELAVRQVRDVVLRMEGPADWESVVLVFYNELKHLLRFDDCSLNLADLEAGTMRLYIVGESYEVSQRQASLHPAIRMVLETGRPVYRPRRSDPLFPAELEERLHSVLDVPFAGGTVAINSGEEHAFSPRDIQLLEQFAQVLSEGHRRLEDLTHLALKEEHLHQAQKLEAIGQLATGVAHEINNPLTSVLGYSELLLRRALDPEVRAHLETIHQEGQRAHQIAGRLLQFVRHQKASSQVLSLNPLVGEVVALVQQQFARDQVQLSAELAPSLRPVRGQPGQLQQLLLALLQNSREALQRAGRGGHIRVETLGQGDQVRLRVVDDGPGIGAGIRERIFEPFFTTKEVGSGVGVGMGLSLCYAIAREHGGRLWAEPWAEGACLVLELPAAGPDEEKTR
jgi:signal transduction histidine kinase